MAASSSSELRDLTAKRYILMNASQGVLERLQNIGLLETSMLREDHELRIAYCDILLELLQKYFDVGNLLLLRLEQQKETEAKYGKGLQIQDLMHERYTKSEFEGFGKQELQQMAARLWHKARPFLTGDYDNVWVPPMHYSHFETGMLLALYRLLYPAARIRPGLVCRFEMSPCHISYTRKVFSDALRQLSPRYLTDIEIWKELAAEEDAV